MIVQISVKKVRQRESLRDRSKMPAPESDEGVVVEGNHGYWWQKKSTSEDWCTFFDLSMNNFGNKVLK